MSHGDDDGLQLPPKIAPQHVIIIPVLLGAASSHAEVLSYCEQLASELAHAQAFGSPIRVHIDSKEGRHSEKRWNWVRRGAPVICELGAREATSRVISYVRRDNLRSPNGEVVSHKTAKSEFVHEIASLLRGIQSSLFERANHNLHSNISDAIGSVDELRAYFTDSDDPSLFKGWVRVPWASPEGYQLERIDEMLKSMKLTIRNIPLHQSSVSEKCLFTGEPAKEMVIIGRAY